MKMGRAPLAALLLLALAALAVALEAPVEHSIDGKKFVAGGVISIGHDAQVRPLLHSLLQWLSCGGVAR